MRFLFDQNIWIRTGNLKTQSIVDILISHGDEIDKFLNDNDYGCFEIFGLGT